MLNMFFIDLGYPCSVPKLPGFVMHFNIVKLLRTAAYRTDMSLIINTTTDFVENMFIEPCRKKIPLNNFECIAQIGEIRLWNVSFHFSIVL